MKKLPDFSLKKSDDLNENDLREHAVWGAYYEPDDLEALVLLGYDRTECELKLRAIDFSDSYVFPLPISAKGEPFKYLYLAVSAVTKGGHSFFGYRTGSGLCLMAGGKKFFFNQAAPMLSIGQAETLANLIGDANIFPITLVYAASDTTELFDLNR